MTLRIEPLSAEDNAGLLALADATSVGTELFRVDRSPDYFALGRQLASDDDGVTAFGAFDGDVLVGSVSVARQRRIVDGEAADTWYLHDLRVSPNARRRGVASALVRALDKVCSPSDPVFATVLDDNEHAPQTLVRAAKGRALARIGQTAHVGLPLVAGLSAAEDLELVMLTAEELAHHRARLAGPDERVVGDPWLRLDGRYFGLARGGEIVWVTCLAIESSRRFVPAQGPVPRLAYVAYPSDRALAWAIAFRDALVRGRHCDAAYLFAGMPAELAESDVSAASLRFTSTTWAFARGPTWSSTDIHELTRI